MGLFNNDKFNNFFTEHMSITVHNLFYPIDNNYI